MIPVTYLGGTIILSPRYSGFLHFNLPKPKNRITMKTVLITGTNRGIGMEAALTVGRAGHKVFATMRNPFGPGGHP
jgi:hypothetical protein